MQYPPLFKTTLISVSLLGLSACGSDSDDPALEDPTGGFTNGTLGTGTTPNVGGETSTAAGGADTGDDDDDPAPTETGSVTGSEADTGATGGIPFSGDNPDLTNATPRYLTMACGDLPVSDTPYSNSMTTPAVLGVGQLGVGRIDPESAGNTEHYWNIDLAAGYYHLVIDSARVDDRNSNTGLEFRDVNAPGETDPVRLLRSSQSGYRTRFYEYIEVAEARTMTIRVAPIYTAEDYTFALFANGSAVPSPYFVDCPTISTLSLSTTQALTLPEAASATDTQWYQVDLLPQDYVLESSAVRSDGQDSNIIYEFGFVDQFGQGGRYERVSRVSDRGTATASGALRRSEAGPVWVTLYNINAELNMEFTLNEDN